MEMARAIELTEAEKELLARIDFKPSVTTYDAVAARANGEAAGALMKSLISRKGIPEIRMRFFTDPSFNVGGKGASRQQIFERNGTRGDAIFRHPHFLRHLRYFIYGADLPSSVDEGFVEKVACCQPVTSGDIIPLGDYARQQARLHSLDAGRAAEEFYKLALDCGLDASAARSIRDAVKRLKRPR